MTAAGSLGLLFFPSIPVILYSVVASVPAGLLYKAGALPGLVLFLVVAVYALVKAGRAQKAAARRIDSHQARGGPTHQGAMTITLSLIATGEPATAVVLLIPCSKL